MVRHSISPLAHIVLLGLGQCWKNGRHTCEEFERSGAEKQEIDCLLFVLDVPAYVIHVADQAGVCLDEDVLSLGVQRLAFTCNAISGLLRATDKIDTGLAGMLGELLQRRFADAAGSTDEDGDETRRKDGGDTGV